MPYTQARCPSRARPAARETMFCSAIPTLTKRSPKALAIPSTAPYPTSAVRNTRSLRFRKSVMSVRANSSRIARPWHGRRVRNRQLVDRLRVLSVVHRQVMGSHGVLHVPDAVTLDGVGDDDDWSSLVVESARARV